MNSGQNGDVVIATVPDSPDARLFIELSSFGSDLTEAHDALDMAVRFKAGDEPLPDAVPFLIGFAVVAYCRTILHSSVRRPLTEHVEIPGEFLEIHQTVRDFRNATIAHSQSNLAATLPVAVLDSGSKRLRDVTAVSVLQTLPWLGVHRFQTLVETMTDLLDEVIHPVRTRLAAALRGVSYEALLAAPRPTVLERLADDFEPRSKRPPYPRSLTLYWAAQTALITPTDE